MASTTAPASVPYYDLRRHWTKRVVRTADSLDHFADVLKSFRAERRSAAKRVE
jgi:hypothetical protein